jgi:hypothetical protein
MITKKIDIKTVMKNSSMTKNWEEKNLGTENKILENYRDHLYLFNP